jgi:hypothetical protein
MVFMTKALILESKHTTNIVLFIFLSFHSLLVRVLCAFTGRYFKNEECSAPATHDSMDYIWSVCWLTSYGVSAVLLCKVVICGIDGWSDVWKVVDNSRESEFEEAVYRIVWITFVIAGILICKVCVVLRRFRRKRDMSSSAMDSILLTLCAWYIQHCSSPVVRSDVEGVANWIHMRMFGISGLYNPLSRRNPIL